MKFDVLGKYILLERLAAGGMAEVFLAKSPGASGISKFVAIKRILPQYSENPDFRNMFESEAKIAINLNHRNVVSIFEYFSANNHCSIVMDFVEGHNLRQFLKLLKDNKNSQKQFSIEQIVYLIKEVAAGLDHAHRCIDGTTGRPLNIIHRDISPQNIMLSYEGEVKIVDFGIAKAETDGEHTRAGTIKGKYGYMSPEQADGRPLDPTTDVFSLGIVLWELLTGERLFASDSEAATLRKIRECQIQSPKKWNPTVPTELERICMKALTKDKTLRYSSAAAFHKDLNRFINTEFPDFAQQDFSQFIKGVAQDEFMAIKQKLVEYSKVQIQTEDRTIVTNASQPGTQTASTTMTEAESEDAPHIPLAVNRVNLQELKMEKPEGQSTIPQFRTPPTPGLTASQPRVRTGTLTGISAGTQSRIAQPARTPFIVPFLTFLLLISASGYLTKSYWQPYFDQYARPLLVGFGVLEQRQNQVPRIEVVESPQNENLGTAPTTALENGTQVTEQASSQLYVTNIDSEPSGARVTIDGVQVGLTPFRTSLVANRDYQIELHRDGYQPYGPHAHRVTEDASTIRPILRQLPKELANISVELINGGTNPEVTINGVRVRPPFESLTVSANVEIKITAYNDFAKMKAEIVEPPLGPNQKRRIQVVLKPIQP